MKKLITVVSALAAGVVLAQVSLSAARAKIGDCINDPAAMTATMKQLPAGDQAAFLAEVNDAISRMPGSSESRTAAFLNVNRAALKGAAKGNVSTLLAEVFATVPPESLTVINERFAADLFNRAGDRSKSYTDEQFIRIATNLMVRINERTASAENGAARSAFAAIMLLRASNGSPADLGEALVKTLPESAQNVARNEWIPAAMGQGQPQSYEPILGAADAHEGMPSNDTVISIAGPQLLDSLLGDIVEGIPVINDMNRVEGPIVPDREVGNNVTPPSKPVPDDWDEPYGYQGQH